MNLIRTIITNIGLTLLCWISILFVFATGNVLVFFISTIAAPDYGWVIFLALVLNMMAGLLVIGIWSGEFRDKWGSIAFLTGFMIASICLGALVFTTVDHFLFNSFYSQYNSQQVKSLFSIPALTVFGCTLFLLKRKYENK